MDAIQALRVLEDQDICREGLVIGGMSWGGYTTLVIGALEGASSGAGLNLMVAAPGPTASTVAGIANAPGGAAEIVHGIVFDHPALEDDVCRALFIGNAHGMVPSITNSDIHAWVGRDDHLFEGARATFNNIDRTTNQVEVVFADNTDHCLDAWKVDNSRRAYLARTLRCAP